MQVSMVAALRRRRLVTPIGAAVGVGIGVNVGVAEDAIVRRRFSVLRHGGFRCSIRGATVAHTPPTDELRNQRVSNCSPPTRP